MHDNCQRITTMLVAAEKICLLKSWTKDPVLGSSEFHTANTTKKGIINATRHMGRPTGSLGPGTTDSKKF